MIAPSDRRKGYALNALELLCSYATTVLKLKNLHCQINKENQHSIELFERTGFQKSGEWTNWINEGGEWSNVLLYQKTLA